MSSIYAGFQVLLPQWKQKKSITRFWVSSLHSKRKEEAFFFPRAISSSDNDGSVSSSRQNHMGYDPSEELLGVDFKPRILSPGSWEPQSWFGPNGLYIRELRCPSCRVRGYTQRWRLDCPQCKGKAIVTCLRCSGDCVVWEESVDEHPCEKAQSTSPFMVKEDDEVDNIEMKLSDKTKSKRIFQSPDTEVGQKISRTLKFDDCSLNAKTGLFSKRMKIIHRDSVLRAKKKAKGTAAAARKRAFECIKAFFSAPESRLKRSLATRGAKYHCKYCGREGHRRRYCPDLDGSVDRRFRCGVCGVKGHNRRTCRNPKRQVSRGVSTRHHRCRNCGKSGHNRRTCRNLAGENPGKGNAGEVGGGKRTYVCRFCRTKGHNVRTCPNKRVNGSDESNIP